MMLKNNTLLSAKNIIPCLLSCAAAALVFYAWHQKTPFVVQEPARQKAAQIADREHPADNTMEQQSLPSPVDITKKPVSPPQQSRADHSMPDEDPLIDPVVLGQAELDLTRNHLYEEKARDSLPMLSVQAHNPVWQLEYEAAEKIRTEQDGSPSKMKNNEEEKEPPKVLPTPKSGEFGNIQPPAGEIWVRIDPSHASEHLDIMNENADLYRSETGYEDPVTITLWVGGRPYVRQVYR